MASSKAFASSGIAGLDAILCGGFSEGKIFLIRGASGVGKTTLSLQFLIEGAGRGETGLYIGTSETEQEIRRVADSHNWSLEGVQVYHHDTAQFGEEQTMLHPAEVELPQVVESLLAKVDEVAPKRVVIDSLAEIRALARDDLWYRRQLMKIKNHFAGNGCTVLLVEIPEAAQATLNSIVSGVIEMEQNARVYGPDLRLLRAVKIREQDFSTGYHDYKIRTGGLAVYPRLIAAEHRQDFLNESVTTGLPSLDKMLHGGLSRGTSTLLLGPSGAGKSVVATQLAVASAERNEPAVMFVFDERVQTLLQRSDGLGLPLRRHAKDGLIRIRQIDPAELSPGEFSHVIREHIEQDGVRMIVLDSLNGYDYAMPGERILSLHLHELTSYLNQHAVNSVFTMTQHGLLSGQSEQPFDVSYIADTVILFRYFEHAGEMHKAMSVYKSRSGVHETSIRELLMGPEGIRVSPPLSQFTGVLTGTPSFQGRMLKTEEATSSTRK